jgi:hypothetical protein
MMSDSHSHPEPKPLHHRKRVVAREVSEVEAANRASAALTPEIFTPEATRPATDDAAVVVDPTTLGRRYRRSSHHRIYRWTQALSMGGALLAAISVVCTMADDIRLSRSLAGPGLVLGVISIVLAGRNSLSARWRGWAIAATVFAAASLSLTWIEPALMRDDATELNVPKPRPQIPANP